MAWACKACIIVYMAGAVQATNQGKPTMSLTPLETAVTRLHVAGYRASPSNTLPGWIVVLDPVRVQHGSEPARIVYDRRTVHPSAVGKFLMDRS